MAEERDASVEIEVDWDSEPAPVYSNGARIMHTQREFSVVLTDFAGFEGRAARERGGAPRARVVGSVRMAPDVFFQFAVACAENWNKYADRFTDPGQESPRFQLGKVAAPAAPAGEREGE